jgi:hypothetical protein
MTNYEKYREEIIKILINSQKLAIVDNKPAACGDGIQCRLCDLSDDGEGCTAGSLAAGLKAWLNAEYVEPPKLTKAERAFCESLQPGCCIVRNVTGCLYVYTEKPVKSGMSWSLPGAKHTCCTSIGAIHNVSFPFVQWEDEQPWKVEDLLKLDVLDEKGEDNK